MCQNSKTHSHFFCKRSIINGANDKNDIHEICPEKNTMSRMKHHILSLYHSHIAGCFIAFFFLRFAFCFFFLLLWIKIGFKISAIGVANTPA